MSENKIDPMDLVKNQDMDAMKWAKAFNDTLVELGYQPHDLGWLVGWFANPIMVGYDLGGSRARKELLKERNEAIKDANEQCQDIFKSRKMIGEQGNEITRLKKIISILSESNDWYGDEEGRWYKEQVIASGTEMASRYDEEIGESVPIATVKGQDLGMRFVPRASLQADHGKRARAAKKEIEAIGE